MTLTPAPLRAAVYLRQSDDRRDDQLAVARQREACRVLCAHRTWEVAREFVDNDVSATKPRRAGTAWADLLKAARAGEIDVVVALRMDRLLRTLKDLTTLIDLNVRIVTVDGELDLATAQGEFVATMMTGIARFEGKRKAERMRLANDQRAVEGLAAKGLRPFGWRTDGGTMTPVAQEQEAIVAAVHSVLAGDSLRSVARAWNAAGFTTSRGKAWASYSVRGVLLNPRVAGLLSHRGQILGKGQWAPVVPEESWRALTQHLTSPSRRTTPGNQRKYALSGLATCGRCGALMTTGRTQKGKRALRCPKSNHLVRAAEPIEAAVEELLLRRLAQPDAQGLWSVAADVDVDGLRARVDVLRAREREASELFAQGAISAAQLTQISVTLQHDLRQAQELLQGSVGSDAVAALAMEGDLRNAWRSYEAGRQQEVLRQVMSIVILPAGRGRRSFDPATLDVRFHGAPAGDEAPVPATG